MNNKVYGSREDTNKECHQSVEVEIRKVKIPLLGSDGRSSVGRMRSMVAGEARYHGHE